ncbi:unnamed protein product [Heligmosomoides polygyrus]|uniref:Carboxypeptidase n=1 Tax=Heligmosomoides polygyrus TaxID=6339 RepID=A0A183F4F5_HELPZ|nr:unnamed protein product [Heligmosomoides polygyrus]
MLCCVFLALLPCVFAQGEKDLVSNLPGLQFDVNFKTYSGYLKANQENTWHMHYMLTESKDNPDTDPVLVWFNGGPGCSSYAGLFEELGPFYVNFGGDTLYENKYSWNAKANVLYLESPIGVGFSYDSVHDSYFAADDSQTALQNYNALKDFFETVQPKYKNRTFFLSGESYAGIYIPMLSQLLVEGINNSSFPNNNFQSNGIDFTGDNSTCGEKLSPLITVPANMFPYNYYEDCYESALIEAPAPPSPRYRAEFQGTSDIAKNTATLMNYISTDSQWGYPCWNEEALLSYSNRRDVQDALHIPDAWRKQANGQYNWTDCNDNIYDNYQLTFNTTNAFFDYVLKNVKTPNFRFLIYNGDVDTVCNYLGDAWHMQDVASSALLQVTEHHLRCSLDIPTTHSVRNQFGAKQAGLAPPASTSTLYFFA